MNEITDGIEVFLIFLGLSIPVIVVGLVYYSKKRLEHKQIIAAIEKGTPLSELKPAAPTGPLWIKNLTAGIAMIIIAIGFACMSLLGYYFGPPPFAYFIMALILLAIGISRLVRGLLQRKTELQTPPNNNTIHAESRP
jgi:hypothetical protein